jgi:hypothetical protein
MQKDPFRTTLKYMHLARFNSRIDFLEKAVKLGYV